MRLFWLRQVMFLGATGVTTVYLASPIPILCYVACLTAELGEVALGRRILAAEAPSPQVLRRFVRWETLVAGWSAVTVSAYGVIVAHMGEEAFLFVPLTYVLAAALYATIFNHPVKPVLMTRMVIYVLGFLAIGGLGLFTAPPERQVLAFAIFFTALSVSFFFVINAIVFRRSYDERRAWEQALIEREARLRREMSERRNAETRFRSLFEGAPIPIREEDLSGVKRLIDALGLPDPDDFAAYIDAHPEFLDACAKEIVVVDANRASLAEHGYTDKSEMLAKVVRTLSPSAKKIVRINVTTMHAGRPGASYETKITRADGDVRTVSATWSVLPGHEGSYGRILLCSVDLTERLAVEEALRQAQKMEAVGQLTGGVAHDFNNLLTVISGNLDLMEATAELELDRDLADPIHKAVQRGSELTQRLLAFSRKQPLSAQPLDLAELITGMTGILHRSLGENGRIAIDTPKHLWPAFADPGQVETALLNLTLNARDAMPGGGKVTFACRNARVGAEDGLDLDPGDYVVLSVADTGTGMPPEVIARAFEPFFTTKEVGKGSGLGLSMVYGFVKQSGGTLEISSTPGVETRLSLYLPRALEAPEGPKPEPVSSQQPGGAIMVLEDDPDIRTLLGRLLQAGGYRVQQARDAAEARRILASGETISLMISDIMLPGGMQGPDVAAELLQTAPGTPVVFVSGRPEEIRSAKVEALRDVDVLRKPFTKAQILGAVEQSLKKRDLPSLV